MSKYKQLDFSKVKTHSIFQRDNKVVSDDFAQVLNEDSPLSAFIDSLPNILAARDFKRFLSSWGQAIEKKATMIMMMGAHVIKVGLSPVVIDAIKHKWITHLALNGAGAIHDVEIALSGSTSEDVGKGLLDGTFGMVQETAEIINESIAHAKNDSGYGEAIARILGDSRFKYRELSILYQAYQSDIPITIHSAIGTEITHQHPNVNGSALGTLAVNDFRIFAHSISKLSNFSVVMNIGSAVILPEVFLKALTVVRNLGYSAFNFTTATFDMIRHYRPTVNVMERPVKPEGQGFYFIGHHELMLPLLFAALKSQIHK
jgi:deoxyhypusine synthase